MLSRVIGASIKRIGYRRNGNGSRGDGARVDLDMRLRDIAHITVMGATRRLGAPEGRDVADVDADAFLPSQRR